MERQASGTKKPNKGNANEIRKKRRQLRKKKNKPRYRKSFKIKRIHFGWWKRRFNIMLDPLKPFERRVLLENPLLKYSAQDDQFVLVLFKIYDMQRVEKEIDKVYKNPYSDTINTLKEIKRSAKEINWKCAICNEPIRSKINEFNTENFLCPLCVETHSKGQFIDERIVHSSVKFRKACEFLYKHQQDTYVRFMRKSERANR